MEKRYGLKINAGVLPPPGILTKSSLKSAIVVSGNRLGPQSSSMTES